MEENNKESSQFWIIVIAWFIASFLILWVIGGACTDPVKGTSSSCLANNAMQGASKSLSDMSKIPIIGVVFNLASLFFPYSQWNSIMYFLAPICGFIFAFVLIRWWNSYFETTEAASPWFFVIILIALLVGYYVNLSFYMGEAASLNSRGGVKYSLYFCLSETDSSTCSATVQKINSEYIAQAQAAKATEVQQLIPIAYWAELRKSMFLTFVLGAIAGWLPLFGMWVMRAFSNSSE